MATGAYDANGIWQYGEGDNIALFSDLLNKSAASVSSAFTADRARLATLEANNVSGLTPMIPSSVVVATGTATSSTLGLVSFTGASAISLNDVFTTSYKNYKILIKIESASAVCGVYLRLRVGGADNSTANYQNIKINADSAGVVSVSASTTTVGDIGATTTTSGNSTAIEVLDAYPAIPTRMNYTYTGGISGGSITSHGGTKFGASTSFTGVTIYPSTGNFTGYLQVLGYNN